MVGFVGLASSSNPRRKAAVFRYRSWPTKDGSGLFVETRPATHSERPKLTGSYSAASRSPLPPSTVPHSGTGAEPWGVLYFPVTQAYSRSL